MSKVEGIHATRTREARNALLQSALEIIGESGFERMTLADIGVRAGYSRGLVQYHYGTKEALISAMIDWAVENGRKMLHDHTRDGLASILAGIDEYARMLRANAPALRGYWVLTTEMSYSRNPLFREQVRTYQQTVLRTFTEAFLQEGISPQRAGAIAMVLFAGFRGLLQQWISDSTIDIDSAFQTLKSAVSALCAEAHAAERAPAALPSTARNRV